MRLPPLSLYIHIPFCTSKCPYCDFHSQANRQPPEERYLRAVQNELLHWRTFLASDSRPIHSIFIGGGTPSLLRPEFYHALLQTLSTYWTRSPACEITLEANPDSLSREKLHGYKQAGINRISLGVQALATIRLKRLGRPHSVEQAVAAVDNICDAGFTNFNIDLIHATPNLSLHQWQQELAQAVETLKPPHISCYSLTLEQGTAFHHQWQSGTLSPLSESQQLAQFNHTRSFLTGVGYDAYEISNFALSGHSCIHNLNYWRFGDYIGLGCAAHGKITALDGRLIRTNNTANVEEFISLYLERDTKEPHPWQTNKPSRNEAGYECLLMGLRCAEGASIPMYEWVTGRPFSPAQIQTLDRLIEWGFVERFEQDLRLTSRGVPMTDSVISQLAETE
ncbi:MAG: radical SAM family heme chaperone HemW [Magnetococcales bacterium]|nr:radical SAM family heme chaperone HemW [Magnetococcales bacterium]